MKILNRLWDDDTGFIVSSELILLTSIVAMGILVGQQTIREVVVGELKDAAMAITMTNQSFTFGGVTAHNSSVAGSSYSDVADFCDGSLLFPAGQGCTNIVAADGGVF